MVSISISFFSSLVVWGWCELAFLTGCITGLPNLVKGEMQTEKQRFILGVKAIIFNELLLILCLSVMLVVTLNGENKFGLNAFVILYVARVSAKLNLFFGVPYINLEFLTNRLRHLEAYCKISPARFFFFISFLTILVFLGLMLLFAYSSGSNTPIQMGYLMLSTLVGLALLEHLFMVIPFRDAKLWNWMLPKFERPSKAIEFIDSKTNFRRENENGL
jgi:putative photosynthetic complex assembly protein 2